MANSRSDAGRGDIAGLFNSYFYLAGEIDKVKVLGGEMIRAVDALKLRLTELELQMVDLDRRQRGVPVHQPVARAARALPPPRRERSRSRSPAPVRPPLTDIERHEKLLEEVNWPLDMWDGLACSRVDARGQLLCMLWGRCKRKVWTPDHTLSTSHVGNMEWISTHVDWKDDLQT